MSDAREAVAQAGLHWHPLHYSSLPGPLSKIMDSISLSNAVRELAKSVSDIDIVHCRSYVPADAALFLKHKYGAKFIFDMRGLWPDQRAEGNRWPQTSLLYRLLYRWWKKKEGNYIRQSDAIISLTDACKSEIKKWGSYNGCPIPVIPCSVDIDEFDVVSQKSDLLCKYGQTSPVFNFDIINKKKILTHWCPPTYPSLNKMK